MRKNILIVSHSFHSFLLNEIEYASCNFEKVVVLTSYNKELYEKFSNCKNVSLELFDDNLLKKESIKCIWKITQPIVFNELNKTISAGLFNKLYIKILLLYLGLDSLLKQVVDKYRMSDEADQWVLMSAWYSAGAYAIAKRKRENNNFFTFSLAHSYEIDKRKTKYTDVLFRYWFVNYIDKTSFISRNVFEEFWKEHSKALKLDSSKFEVRYLGTHKLINGYNQGNPDERTINILSCSNIISVKRLDLILEAINLTTNYKINWYHIGTGVLSNDIKMKCDENTNDLVKVFLLGQKSNKEVHQFLSSKEIDMFVNVSSSEGVPVSIMEALAYGIPAIATDVGGNAEIVDDQCGIIISSDPTKEIVYNAIVSLKERLIFNKTNVSRNAVKKYEDYFNSDKIRQSLYCLLRSM